MYLQSLKVSSPHMVTTYKGKNSNFIAENLGEATLTMR
jgi:hypothetical protein